MVCIFVARPTLLDPQRGDARGRLLDAARDVIRAKGYAATTLDDLCLEAGVTKGAFFHHFPNKEALALAAVEEWNTEAMARFAAARHRAHDDPLERVLAYIARCKALVSGELALCTCLAGTILQEVHGSPGALRDACARAILDDAAALEADLAEAIELHGAVADCTPASLARHVQAVIQGSFILAKATGDAATARDSLDHLARYLELSFPCPASTRAPATSGQ